MFFKSNDKYNHEAKAYKVHWRLVESYRDVDGIVRNRTIVNAGFIDHLSAEKLNTIQKILSNKVLGKETIDYEQDEEVNFYVDELFQKMIKEKKIDIVGYQSKPLLEFFPPC
jgi:hypothetical protein